MDKANDIFYYDETSKTCLRWKVDRFSWAGRKKNASADDEAGSLDHRGDAFTTRLNGKAVKVHNIVAELCGIKLLKGEIIDIAKAMRSWKFFNLDSLDLVYEILS